MDKTLDDIIATKKVGRRRGPPRRGSARAQTLGKPLPAPATRARVASTGVKAAVVASAASATEKIIVSGLPVDVNETQIKELFATTVGALRGVTLHYDSSGRSKGIASVQFSKKGDATKAYQQYNNRLIDGMKPMKIEIVVAPAPVPLASRVSPATNGTTPRAGGPRAGRRRGGKTGTGRKDRPAKSAADLDAEMEDYTASNAPTAAASAATA